MKKANCTIISLAVIAALSVLFSTGPACAADEPAAVPEESEQALFESMQEAQDALATRAAELDAINVECKALRKQLQEIQEKAAMLEYQLQKAYEQDAQYADLKAKVETAKAQFKKKLNKSVGNQ